MIELLARIFIKDHKDVDNPVVRRKYGILCGAAGIFFNVLLAAMKFIAGILSKSISVTADAVNNLSDSAGSLITIFGFKLSGKKPDADHPFGHGRIEYIAGLMVAFSVLLVGLELLRSSIMEIIEPSETSLSFWTFLILSLSVLVKFYMFVYNRATGKKINSVAMDAVAKDSLSDTVSTFAVIVAAALSLGFPQWNLPFDGIAGVVVSLFILWNGFEAVKDTVDPLLGKAADEELVKQIEATALENKSICGIHDLVVHDYGPGRLMITFHAEVPGDGNIYELHDDIDVVEMTVSKKFNCIATIHMDPIDFNNPELKEVSALISEVAKNIDERITVHDVRIVPGTSHTNLIFDAVRPHDCKYSVDELKSKISEGVMARKPFYFCVIHVDSPF